MSSLVEICHYFRRYLFERKVFLLIVRFIDTGLGLLKCFLVFVGILLYVIPCNSRMLSHLTMNNQLRTGTDKGNLTV